MIISSPSARAFVRVLNTGILCNMTQRHWVQNDRIFLVTTNTKKRAPIFQDDAYACTAVESLYIIQERQPFYLHAFVVMPDHCHVLLTVPEYSTLSSIMYAYKRDVSFRINRGPLWQKRFDCRLMRKIPQAIHYIHHNPIVAGLCAEPEDYRWSSACGKWDVTAIDAMGMFA